MRVNDVQLYLEKINPELFSFSYALVPDDLQAQQIVIDAAALLFSEENKLLFNLNFHNERWQLRSSRIKKILYQFIFRICKRRFRQIKESIKWNDEYAPFFKLELEERAVIFLKHKTHMDIEDIEEILEVQKPYVLAKINCAREKLCLNLGMSNMI